MSTEIRAVTLVQSLTRSDRIEDFGVAVAVVEMARQQAAKQACDSVAHCSPVQSINPILLRIMTENVKS